MLFFLAIAAKSGFVIDEYTDAAIGRLGKNADGKRAITKVILRPSATYSGERIPDWEEIEKMHQRAHEMCFIANSVTSEVTAEIVS